MGDQEIAATEHMRRLGIPLTVLRPMAFMELMTERKGTVALPATTRDPPDFPDAHPPPAYSDATFRLRRFPPEVIVMAVRWYLRFGLSYRDVEELLAERRIEVDHVSVYRRVHRFTPLLAGGAARPCRHAVGDRWHLDETYLKVAGRWRYLYRAIDRFGQVVDVFLSGQANGTPWRPGGSS